MKFKKKPVEIEAEQFLPFENDFKIPTSNVACVYMDTKDSKTNWSIKTLEGRYDVTPGDWIITGVKGEVYPCKPDIFKMTYDRVEETKEFLDNQGNKINEDYEYFTNKNGKQQIL